MVFHLRVKMFVLMVIGSLGSVTIIFFGAKYQQTSIWAFWAGFSAKIVVGIISFIYLFNTIKKLKTKQQVRF